MESTETLRKKPKFKPFEWKSFSFPIFAFHILSGGNTKHINVIENLTEEKLQESKLCQKGQTNVDSKG